MSNTDVAPEQVTPEQEQAQTDRVPLYPNNPNTPFTPGGSDLSSVARRQQITRLPQTNRAQGMNLAFAGQAAPGAPGWVPGKTRIDDQGQEQPLATPAAVAPQPPPPTPDAYTPQPPVKDTSMWGKVPSYLDGDNNGMGPDYPSPLQAYGVIGRSAQAMSLWGGPPSVTEPAGFAFNLLTPIQFVLNAFSNGQFQARFDASYLARLKAQQIQMAFQHQNWLQASSQDLTRYRELFQIAQDTNMNERLVEQKVREFANNAPGGPDRAILFELDNRGLNGVKSLIDWRAAHYLDGELSRRALNRANPDLSAEEAYQPGGGTGGVSGGRQYTDVPGYHPPAETAQGPETPAAPVNEPPPKSEQEENVLDEALAKRFKDPTTNQPAAPAEVDEMHDLVNGHPSDNWAELKKLKGGGRRHAEARIAGGSRELQQGMEREAKNDKNDTDTKLKNISKIDKETAGNVERLVNYDAEAKDLTTDRHQQARLEALAQNVDHNYRPGTFKIVQKYKDPNSKEGIILRRATSLPTAVLKLNYALRPLDEISKIPSNQIALFAAEHWTGDPKYADLHTAIRQVATEAVAIEMGTGTPRVSQINEQVKFMTASGSPGQIRVQAQTLLRNAYAAVKQINQQFQEEVRDPSRNAPGIFNSSIELTDGLLRVTPTGQVPSDAPDVLKGANKPKGPRPSWLKEGEDRAPITRSQINKAKEFIKKYENDPDPDIQRELQKYRERIGLDW
jgi:hypothetical protein